MKKQILLSIFLFGLLVKVAIMPWAMHSDLLSMYFRAHLMAEHGVWGLGTGQYLSHFIYALNLLVLKLAGWNLEEMFFHDFGLHIGSLTASVGDWLRFNEHPLVNSFIFWLKMPHLLVDVGVFLGLYKIFEKHKSLNLILASWWLNPVNIYAFYVFSRHDVFTAAILLLVIVLVAKNKVFESLLSIFSAIQIRVQPLLLAPVFLVQLFNQSKNHKKFFIEVLKAVVVIGFYLLLLRVLPNSQAVLEELGLSGRAQSPAALGLPARHAGQATGTKILGIPVFLALYAVLGIWWLLQKKLKKLRESDRLLELIKITTAVMCLYFAINPFSPHYFAWLSIFVSLSLVINQKLLFGYVIAVLGWFGLGVFSTDTTWFSQNLLTPVSLLLFRTPQISQLVATRLSNFGVELIHLRAVSQILLSGGLFWMVWQIYEFNFAKLKSLSNYFKKILPIFIATIILLTNSQQSHAVAVPVLEQKLGSVKTDIATVGASLNFTSPVDEFGSVEVRLGTDRSNKPGTLYFRIKETLPEQETPWLHHARFKREDLYNGYFFPIGFEPIKDAKGKTFYFELNARSDDAPIFSYSKKTGELSFTVIADQPMSVFIDKLREELSAKIRAQSSFFWFYFLLLGGIFALLLGSLTKIIAFKVKKASK